MEGRPRSFLVAVWVTVIVGSVLALIGGGLYGALGLIEPARTADAKPPKPLI
jgi:hypothetical protein